MDASLVKSQTKFLHDLATPISIIGIVVRKIEKEFLGESPVADKEKQIKRIQKLIKAVESLELLHANRKSEISKSS